MAKTLVLAEKPSVAKEIARVLGCKGGQSGYISGGAYIVTWALGHLVTLAEPEHYGEQYKSWRMDTLPMLPEKMALKVIPETTKQYKTVRSLLMSAEVGSIIIATDAGREGELVARWIIKKAGCKKPIRRLWISSQTDKAIKEGFASLRDGREYENLYHSAEARAEADWLVGLNVTRALTCKFSAQLSAGRVQTPTLALIARREEEIRKFVPKEYYTVNADLGGFFVTYRDGANQSAIYDEAQAKMIADRAKSASFQITDIQSSDKRTPPPMLYDLTELQRDGNKLYGFSPKETLSIMQRLYEHHKILTYPRTDSRYLTDDIVPTLRERLIACSVGEFAKIAGELIRSRKSIAKACINNAKVSDHHAIIPTEEPVRLSELNNEEKKIYFLVLRRFLTCFYPDSVYRQIKIRLKAGPDLFTAAGKEVLEKGWRAVYELEEETEEVEQTLPSLQKGQKFRCVNVQLKAGKTSPPSRYTEASLLSAMENPSKYIADKTMKEYIGGGLGTPATRADIIDKLFSSFYIEKKGKSIHPTSKGRQLIELVPEELREPLLTAKWEQELEGISKGKAKKEAFIAEIRGYSSALVNQVKNSTAKYMHDNVTRTPCPDCGKMMLEVSGKKGKMLVCQDRECGYRRNISFNSRVRCPNCHKFMEVFGEKEARTYVCPCGFREKVDRFHEKLDSQPGANKSDVKKYLDNQQKGGGGFNALAAALAKAQDKQGR
ncbi:MAG TPA: DNA topoisomerase III [Ruminococcaceae bacterium]|nr:DNA topoisomerase III [Oscillospiraceae bacterium]